MLLDIRHLAIAAKLVERCDIAGAQTHSRLPRRLCDPRMSARAPVCTLCGRTSASFPDLSAAAFRNMLRNRSVRKLGLGDLAPKRFLQTINGFRNVDLHRCIRGVGHRVIGRGRASRGIVWQQAWKLAWRWTRRDRGPLQTTLTHDLQCHAICPCPEWQIKCRFVWFPRHVLFPVLLV